MSFSLSLRDIAFLRQGETDLCAVQLDDGGGDTFDCYAEEMDVVDTTLDSGTAWTGAWFYGDSDVNNPKGDTFDSYSIGEVADDSLDGGMSNTWDGPWLSGEGFAEHSEDFESYNDGAYVSGELDGGENMGPWQVTGDLEAALPLVEGDFRYIRLLIGDSSGSTDFSGVLELELRESIGGPSAATGGVASANAEFVGFEAAKAFDGSLASGNGWVVNNSFTWPTWLQYDFGVGVTRRIVEYRVGSYSTTTLTAIRSARIWRLQGSNDAVNWTTLHDVNERSPQTGWTFGQMRTFPL